MSTDLIEVAEADLIPLEGTEVAPANSFELIEVDENDLIPIEPEARSVGEKIVGRFMGTDVDDPQELTRMGGLIVGGVSGGLAGSRVPRAPGPAGIVINPVTGAVSFGLIGTAAGAISPEIGMEVGEAVGFLPPGTRDKMGLSPQELRTVLEGELLLDVATAGGLSALRLTGRGVSSLMAGVGKAERQVAEEAAQQGIALLPIQVGERWLARGYVSVMGRFPIFGGVIRRRGQEAEVAAKKAIDAVEQRVGPIAAWHEIGEMIYKDASELLNKTNDIFGKAYTDIWQQADELGVAVVPRASTEKAIEVLDVISKKTPQVFDESGQLVDSGAGPVLEGVRKFVIDEVLPLRSVTSEGTTMTVKQTFQQMDGLLTKIDQQIATLEPGQRRFAMSLYTQLRQSVQLDMVQNLSAKNAADAMHVAHRLSALDKSFSYTMSQLFETATANRFASVKRRGLRAFGFEESTRIPIDQLQKLVVDARSPQMVEELSRLVGPETMQRITTRTIRDAIQKSFADNQFRPEVFARQLGLDDITSGQAQSLAKMLQESGSELDLNDLQKLLQSTRAIAASEVPDISTFVARRATIGGIRSAVGAIVPAMVITSGAASFGGASLMTALMAVGGGRLLSAAISSPRNARFLKSVLSEEATSLVKRKAVIQIIRTGIQALEDDGEIDRPTAAKMEKIRKVLMIELDKAYKAMPEDEDAVQ